MLSYIKKLKAGNGFGYFFLKVLALGLILFIIDFTVGSAFKLLYLKQRSGWEYWTKYSVNDTKADMIIMGSSRAQQQYNPEFFEERMAQSCYNAGRDGQSILYQYPVMLAILKRHQPKTLMLEVENKMFAYNGDSYDRLSCLLPFYHSNPEMDSVLLLRGDHEQVKLLSRMYPYNSLALKILSGTVKKKDNVIKGYLPLERSLPHDKHRVILNNNYNIDSTRLHFFTSIVLLCKQKNIQLYFTCSPYFSLIEGEDSSMNMVKSIAAENNIPFINLSAGLPALNDPKLYDDTVHVNRTGSKILSNIIIDSLLKYKQPAGK